MKTRTENEKFSTLVIFFIVHWSFMVIHNISDRLALSALLQQNVYYGDLAV